MNKSNTYITIITLLLIAFVTHVGMRMHIISSNGDDLRFVYQGILAENHGWDTYYERALDLATHQGRFYFVATIIIAELPHFLKYDTLRVLSLVMIYFLAGFSISSILYKFYKSKKLSILFFFFYLFTVPVYGAWYAFFHWTFYWMIPIVIFGIAFHLHTSLLKSDKPPLLFSSVLFVLLAFFSILFSEMYFLGFGLILLINYLRHIDYTSKNSIKSYLSELINKKFIVTAIPFAIYLGFYLMFHSQYATSGNRVGTKLAFNFGFTEVYGALKAFLVSATPINHMVLGGAKKGWADFLSNFPIDSSFGVFAFLFIVLFIAYLISVIVTSKFDKNSIELSWFKVFMPFFTGLSFGILQVFTITYQNWLVNFRPWYTPTFHISIGLIISLLLLCFKCASHPKISNRLGKWTRRGIVTLIVAPIIFITLNAYRDISNSMRHRNVSLHLLYKMKNSKWADFVPEGSKIYFPELDLAVHVTGESFLSELFKKDYSFTKKANEINVDSIPTYIFKIYRPGDLKNTGLIVGKIDQIMPDETIAINELLVIPYHSFPQMTINADYVLTDLDEQSLFIGAAISKNPNGIVARYANPVDVHSIDVVSIRKSRSFVSNVEKPWKNCKLKWNAKRGQFVYQCKGEVSGEFKTDSKECVYYDLDIQLSLRGDLPNNKSENQNDLYLYIDSSKIADIMIDEFSRTGYEIKRQIRLCPGNHNLSLGLLSGELDSLTTANFIFDTMNIREIE